MNEDMVQGKWTEFKGELQKSWGKITGDEFEATKGDVGAIAGLLQQRYGIAKEEAGRRVSEIAARYNMRAGEKMEQIKEKVADTVESAKNRLRN